MSNQTSTSNWIKYIVYGAGMQGACPQDIADLIVELAIEKHYETGNNPSYCLAQMMDVFNERKQANFSQTLINWLKIN